MALKPKHEATGYGAAGSSSYKRGHLQLTDKIPAGDAALGPALYDYAQEQDSNRTSIHWRRVVPWMENIFFGLGRHYVDDILVNRLTGDSTGGNQNLVMEATRNIPRPTNDMLHRYIETNIALLTENQPRPRFTPKSEKAEDHDAAELSELTIEYLWEALKEPEKHREIVRILLHCGVCWKEVCWDPTMPRRMTVPQTQTEPMTIGQKHGLAGVELPGATHEVTQRDKSGRVKYDTRIEYGELSSAIVSPFEMHIPTGHEWNGPQMGWVMREYYINIEALHDKYANPKLRKALGGHRNGWYLDRMDDISSTNIQALPLWWWERLSDMVEGPGQGIYGGNSEMWEGYATVRIFDRQPSPEWPKGRTVILMGNVVIYDSPKARGARAYDPRWPHRWHPYVRFRWEAQIGSIYGRSLLTKLLPKLKRVNSIDTTLIMWRRTVPIATWISPKGANVTQDLWTGKPGQIWEYDPIRTRGAKPEAVFPQPYPEAALKEREQQIQEMEAISGTEEILRGQRPIGVNSATMIDILRKQALASRSAILSAWDESLQEEGSAMIQEVIKNVKDDPRYAERLRIIAREKKSRLTINEFVGTDLSDNVVCRVDTASMALVSKEAREAKALEFLQYAPGLMSLPIGLRQAIIEELGFKDSLNPQGPDVERAKRMMSWIRQGQFERIIPFPEDDPRVFYELFKEYMQSDELWDLDENQQELVIKLVETYKKQVQIQEQQALQMQMMMAQMGQDPQQGGGGAEGAPPQ